MDKYENTILITGGTTGLGFQAALSLARQQPKTLVLIASRKDPDQAATKINKTLKQSNVQYLPLDLSSFKDIRRFSSEYASSNYPPLAALILNAGLQFHSGINYTVDGFEATFGVNHIGHALLFFLLKPYLATKSRIIVVSSGTHDPEQKTQVPDALYTSAEQLAHPGKESKGDREAGLQRYSTSKLCNVLWTYALERHLLSPVRQAGGKQWTANAFDPGLMPGTRLARDSPLSFVFEKILPYFRWLLRLFIGDNVRTPAESGAALARLAVGQDSEVKGVSGQYFEGMNNISSSVASYEKEKQDDLWEWTVKNVARDESERQEFVKM